MYSLLESPWYFRMHSDKLFLPIRSKQFAELEIMIRNRFHYWLPKETTSLLRSASPEGWAVSDGEQSTGEWNNACWWAVITQIGEYFLKFQTKCDFELLEVIEVTDCMCLALISSERLTTTKCSDHRHIWDTVLGFRLLYQLEYWNKMNHIIFLFLGEQKSCLNYDCSLVRIQQEYVWKLNILKLKIPNC